MLNLTLAFLGVVILGGLILAFRLLFYRWQERNHGFTEAEISELEKTFADHDQWDGRR
ncbi:MAG: hypothetical protein MN733_10305 [Nitrososphaera sp.]|nr:hypothetical protein [Nitrososphaera sp.]